MNKKSAVFAGSFDPFTLAHEDILRQGLSVFDDVHVVCAISPSKKSWLPVEKRMELIGLVVASSFGGARSRVQIVSHQGLIVDYCKKVGATHLIRGLRGTAEFESERSLAAMNEELNKDIKTLFFMTNSPYLHISSSFVREIHSHRGDFRSLVSPLVFKALSDKS